VPEAYYVNELVGMLGRRYKILSWEERHNGPEPFGRSMPMGENSFQIKAVPLRIDCEVHHCHANDLARLQVGTLDITREGRLGQFQRA